MNLRSKVVVIILTAIIICFAVLSLISNMFILSGFEESERLESIEAINRLERVIYSNIDEMDTMLYDWAAWDDTYNFLSSADEGYIESNLGYDTFASLNIDFVAYIDKEGEMVLYRLYDWEKGEAINASSGLIAALALDETLSLHNSLDSYVRGLTSFENEIWALASRPIITSFGEGPIAGTMIMARRLDSDEAEHYEWLSMAPVSINTAGEKGSMGQQEEPAVKLFDVSGDIFLSYHGEEELRIYKTLDDIHSNPSIEISLILDRKTYLLGKDTVRYLFIIFFLIAFVSVITGMYIVQKKVTSRIFSTILSVENISRRKNSAGRLEVKGNDELATLTNSINTMLDSLEFAERKARESGEKFKAIFDAASDSMFIHDLDGNFIEANQTAVKTLGYKRDELLKMNIKDIDSQDSVKMEKPRTCNLLEKGFASFEVAHRTKKGRLIPTEINAAVINFEGKSAILSIARDITERKKHAEDMKKRNEELEKIQRLSVDRELKMIELKRKIKELEGGM